MTIILPLHLLCCHHHTRVPLLQLYGSLVGIFELNNLSLTVPAPVARYKHMLLHPDEAGLAAAEAAAALDEVRPLLEALGDEADAPAEVRSRERGGGVAMLVSGHAQWGSSNGLQHSTVY